MLSRRGDEMLREKAGRIYCVAVTGLLVGLAASLVLAWPVGVPVLFVRLLRRATCAEL